MAEGSLCISIDLELAWGIWDKPSTEYHARCAEHERAIVSRLLELFDRYHISATWAIVARLLDPSPARAGSIWYAPDLVEKIQRAAMPQEIGSHGYEHLYFAETDRERLREDLEAAREVHKRHGLEFRSFVFPRNQVAHLDLLESVGLSVFRSVDRGWHTLVRKRLGVMPGRVANLVDKVLPIPPAVVAPVQHGQLQELPSSMLLLGRNGVRRAVPRQSLISKARFGMARASRRRRIFHLWFHPSNFYYDMEGQLDTFEQILLTASKLRDRGRLTIRPMNGYAQA